jgi:diguanylate cyclase (GGDEF)-like protein
MLVLAGLACTLCILGFLIFAAFEAVRTIDGAALAHETLQVTRAVAAAPGGMNEITLAAMSDTLDLDGAHFTTIGKVSADERAVGIGGDRVVAWKPHLFGTRTFGIVAPMRIVAGVLFTLIVALIGWRVYAVGQGLDRRRAVASRLAMTDGLTGLANRLAFDDALNARIAEANAGGPGFVLVSIDLDDFKAINDVFGHAAGDAMLKAVAQCLRDAAEPGDVVARIGGDEFAVIRSGAGLDAYVEAVSARLSQPLVEDGREFSTGASFGIARSEDFPGSSVKLSQAADAALYRAKRSGRGSAEIAMPPPPPRRYAA